MNEIPENKDTLIDRALADALDALGDMRLIDMTIREAVEARKEIESILAAFAERARRIANQEARDAE